ncbi:ribbon-helix-helix domain-containing protein [Novosphingopyxis sp.]|uniref:ribbon-helix-helix domain-containing protein n=1 Tax=Novosphingopyxis sp. TaxID=2709690 RepID=UPI003B5B0885
MPATREGFASVNLGAAKQIGLRLVAQGRFENLSDACRAGLRRLEQDARVVERLVALGQEGMASGVDDSFEIDAFVEEVRTGA